MSTSWRAGETARSTQVPPATWQRAWEHRSGVVAGFTRKYGCKLLVWYQVFESLDAARQREKQMTEWKRLWKVREIETMNPDWDDLYDRIAIP